MGTLDGPNGLTEWSDRFPPKGVGMTQRTDFFFVPHQLHIDRWSGQNPRIGDQFWDFLSGEYGTFTGRSNRLLSREDLLSDCGFLEQID